MQIHHLLLIALLPALAQVGSAQQPVASPLQIEQVQWMSGN